MGARLYAPARDLISIIEEENLSADAEPAVERRRPSAHVRNRPVVLPLEPAIQVADGLESMRCRFQSLVDIGGAMRRGQEHVVLGMKEGTVPQRRGAERPALSCVRVSVEQHQRHLRRAALADCDAVLVRQQRQSLTQPQAHRANMSGHIGLTRDPERGAGSRHRHRAAPERAGDEDLGGGPPGSDHCP